MLAGDRARRQAKARSEHARTEVQFWMNVYALSRYARPQDLPPLRRYRRPRPAPFIPAQRSAPPGVPAQPKTRRDA